MTEETALLQRKAACRKEEGEVINQPGVEAVRNEEASSFLTSEMGTQLGFGTFRSLSLSPAQF